MLYRFEKWLSTEPRSVLSATYIILLAIAFKLIWAFVVGRLLLSYEAFATVADDDLAKKIRSFYSEVNLPHFLLVLHLIALQEELVYRALPVAIWWSASKSLKTYSLHLLFVAVLCSSVIFGYVHFGLKSILLQGVGGLVLSIVYVKCGGFNGKVIKPLLVSTLVHSLYNNVLIAFVLFA